MEKPTLMPSIPSSNPEMQSGTGVFNEPGSRGSCPEMAMCMIAEDLTSCDIGPEVLVLLYDGIERPP